MKFATLLTASACALALAACGGAEDARSSDNSGATAPVETAGGDTMGHAGHDMSTTGSGATGHSTGVIMSLDPRGDSLVIDHGPIEGMGMDAMSMGFGIQGDVDLSALAEGDTVEFMVRKGRDNVYRVAAICNTATDGAGCLSGMMDH